MYNVLEYAYLNMFLKLQKMYFVFISQLVMPDYNQVWEEHHSNIVETDALTKFAIWRICKKKNWNFEN